MMVFQKTLPSTERSSKDQDEVRLLLANKAYLILWNNKTLESSHPSIFVLIVETKYKILNGESTTVMTRLLSASVLDVTKRLFEN